MAPRAPPKAPAAMAAAQDAKKGSTNVPLAPKAAQLFRQLLQQYELKQWKQGVKTADTILKTRPDHGETLAMKGLFLSCTADRKAEGYECVKKGVLNDMGSHIVWHVYGIMHRADKNYEEALKCYVQANRIEKDSLNIIQDLALLTIHLRNYTAYAEARLSILRAAPRTRRNWVGLAVAQHLAGQYFEADRTLRSYEEMLREVPSREYEHSEVLLYHAFVLEEAGELEPCLEFLGEHAGAIVDRQAYSVQRARLLLKLGRTEPAEWAWELLLEENPDSYEYIKSYVRARGADVDSTTEEGRAAAVVILDILAEKHSRSLAIRRITLELVKGDDFRTRVSTYLTSALSKGVPSIFADLKSLYSDPTKRDIIGDLALTFRDSLVATSNFGVPVVGSSDDTIEPSSVYLWTLYFLAQHQSALGAQPEALAYIEEAIAHTPSLPELPMLKARVLRRGGDVLGALAAMTEARMLDGQDRFLNSKNAKYLIRADKIEEAEAVVGLFTKKDAPSPLDDLVDMQCLWLLQEEGDSFVRQSKFALALKRFHQIFAVFTEIEEDQYDFHSYCLRKSTLRAYVQLLRYADQLRSHPGYLAAARGAINIYLRMHDDRPSVLPVALTNGAADAAAEKKAEAELKKKAEKEKALELASKDKGKKTAKKTAEEDEAPAAIVDQDPVGDKLLETTEPLAEALKFLRPLEKAAPHRVSTWLLSYEVAIRREKYGQALRALRNAAAIDASSAALHPLLMQFTLLVPSLDLSEPLRATITATLPSLLNSLPADAFNAQCLQRNPASPEHIVAAARGLMAISGKATSDVEDLLFQILRPETTASLQPTVEALSLFKSHLLPRLDEFKQGASRRFPLATAFKSGQVAVVEEEKREVEDVEESWQ